LAAGGAIDAVLVTGRRRLAAIAVTPARRERIAPAAPPTTPAGGGHGDRLDAAGVAGDVR
jgi:hypothetical protein